MPKSSILRLDVRAFRSFREEASLDIRPLTLLYGYNQAGKSSLLRLLLLLADSLQDDAGPLDLRCLALRGATFKELGWLGRNPELSPWITIKALQVPGKPTLRAQFADVQGLVVNRLHLIPEGGDKFMADLDGPVTRVGRGIEANYAGTYRGERWNGQLKFRSLFPSGLPEQAEALAEQVRTALAPLRQMQWLHANRAGENKDESKTTRCCQPSGSDLASLLSGSGEEREALAAASRWLGQQPDIGGEIAPRRAPSGEMQIVHRATEREELPLHIAGEGLRALLPVLLCACWAETRSPAAPSLIAVEEPEAHLHPSLQVALFDRLLEMLRTVCNEIPVVLETHSVYLLRAMQLAVLEGRLAPADVALHWIEQTSDGAGRVASIEVQSDATLGNWRPDVFEKEQELAFRILDRRWSALRAKHVGAE